MICDRCGKQMENPQGETLAGIQIKVDFTGATPSMQQLFEESMGKHFTGVYKMEWHICYECWLDSLGVK